MTDVMVARAMRLETARGSVTCGCVGLTESISFGSSAQVTAQRASGRATYFRGILVPLFPNSMYEKTRRGFDAMNRVLKQRVETLYA
jgi:hypothetical protein